jgi:hypothetical protein
MPFPNAASPTYTTLADTELSVGRNVGSFSQQGPQPRETLIYSPAAVPPAWGA